MFNKQFDQINKSDVDALVANEVVEAKHLEYKQKLPGNTTKEKCEFAEDVSSFANASGGHIVYGLGDKKDGAGKKTGTPEYVGLGAINIDEQKLRLEHMHLNGIEPRIAGIQIKPVEGFDNGPVMVMRIPQSWASPHMVKHNNRFYSRTSSGKYPLDVHEIRVAFALSEALPERIRRFRADRLAKIVAGETPIPLNDGAKIILHVVPCSSFSRQEMYNLASPSGEPLDVPPIYGQSWNRRHNFDGVLSFYEKNAYVQIFRNGVIEALDSWMIQASGEKKELSRGYEKEILEALKAYLVIQKRLGVETPVFVMLSLLGVRGYGIGGVSSLYSRRGQDLIERDTLVIPEVIIEEYECDISEVMRPAFDSVWNAVGWPRSMNYDDNGKWTE